MSCLTLPFCCDVCVLRWSFFGGGDLVRPWYGIVQGTSFVSMRDFPIPTPTGTESWRKNGVQTPTTSKSQVTLSIDFHACKTCSSQSFTFGKI